MVSPVKDMQFSCASPFRTAPSRRLADLRDQVTQLAKEVWSHNAERRTRADPRRLSYTAEAGASELRRTIRRQPVIAMAAAAAVGAVFGASRDAPASAARREPGLALGQLDAQHHARRPARFRRQYFALGFARRPLRYRVVSPGLRASGRCAEPCRHGVVDELARRQGERLVPEGAGQGQGKVGLMPAAIACNFPRPGVIAGALFFAVLLRSTNVIPGLVPRIHLSVRSVPSRALNPGNKCRDDKVGDAMLFRAGRREAG